MTRVLLCLSHSIEEYDQLRLLHSLGYEVCSIGGYIEPAAPHDPKRPPLAHIPFYPDLKAAVDNRNGPDNLGEAQRQLPDAFLEWLGDDGVIIYHHYLERLFSQWPRLRDWRAGSSRRRLVWRTVGQSVEANERAAAPFRADGLEIVRYSPHEANIPGYAGSDATIRFYKNPGEWRGWVGDEPLITNVTQHLRDRDPYTNHGYWARATEGLPTEALGPGSEHIGGTGELELAKMQERLRSARAYLYCGTQPASYTLALIEAMMTGTPVYSIGPSWMRVFPYGHELYEGHLLAGYWSDEPLNARATLRHWLDDHDEAAAVSAEQRARAVALFSPDRVGADWKAFLG